MKIQLQAIENVENWKLEALWCSRCDLNVVKPNNQDTGRFFAIHGTVRKDSYKVKETDKSSLSDDYEQVVFAICTDCLKNAHEWAL